MNIRHDKKTAMRPLRDMMVEVASRHSIEPGQISRKSPEALPARKEFIRRAYAKGYPTRQIAAALNYHPQTIRKLRNT